MPVASSQGPGHVTASPRLTWDLPALALGVPTPIVAYLMSTLTGLGFFFFILKRRGLPGDSATIVRATASGSDGPAAAPELEVGIATSATHDETALAPDPPSDDGPAPDEVGVPRWLRGSLREGRIGRSTGRVRGWD